MKSILDVINENINTVNENVLDMMKKITDMEQEIIALSLMLKAPEQPNTRGEEGASVTNSELIQFDEV